MPTGLELAAEVMRRGREGEERGYQRAQRELQMRNAQQKQFEDMMLMRPRLHTAKMTMLQKQNIIPGEAKPYTEDELLNAAISIETEIDNPLEARKYFEGLRTSKDSKDIDQAIDLGDRIRKRIETIRPNYERGYRYSQGMWDIPGRPKLSPEQKQDIKIQQELGQRSPQSLMRHKYEGRDVGPEVPPTPEPTIAEQQQAALEKIYNMGYEDTEAIVEPEKRTLRSRPKEPKQRGGMRPRILGQDRQAVPADAILGQDRQAVPADAILGQDRTPQSLAKPVKARAETMAQTPRGFDIEGELRKTDALVSEMEKQGLITDAEVKIIQTRAAKIADFEKQIYLAGVREKLQDKRGADALDRVVKGKELDRRTKEWEEKNRIKREQKKAREKRTKEFGKFLDDIASKSEAIRRQFPNAPEQAEKIADRKIYDYFKSKRFPVTDEAKFKKALETNYSFTKDQIDGFWDRIKPMIARQPQSDDNQDWGKVDHRMRGR
jgi:hypothetical protein